MVSRLPVIDDDGEVGDLSEVDPSLFKPAHEVLPRQLQETLGMRRRGPQKSPTKVATTIRIDADVLEALKATGRGWQTRANDLLRADIEAGRL
ncbi:hypothetical protein GT347_06275 [Xylophilus rhododendri]|uniref:BrnA antitoxin of type II toxin-antitoxin system n=1 Tax=Xylophilus rhododendri TaxID=2697032 RepID=A0A857J432_9BURK|nr:hypothetical protein GT347_06275 [Xylophilus rhododendri]